MDGGGDVSNVVREEASGGRAALAVPRAIVMPSVAPGRRVWRARRRRMVMKVAASAPVVSAARASCRAPRHCRLSTPPSSRDGGVE